MDDESEELDEDGLVDRSDEETLKQTVRWYEEQEDYERLLNRNGDGEVMLFKPINVLVSMWLSS